jgi:hypothetical protein
MRNAWQTVVEALLRPARPELERCLAERARHLTARGRAAEERALAIDDCQRRIEACRRAVFAANDGVVPPLMTDLEREWRTLSRAPDRGSMDLWARIAPTSWLDRKRWQDTDTSLQVDAATALAADVEGVEAAESAIDSLRAALAPWGTPVGPRIRWRLLEQDSEHGTALHAGPLRAARERAALRGAENVVVERATRLQQAVRQATLARLPGRPLLAGDVGQAAFLECLWRATPADLPDPVSPLRDLWMTGYVLAAIDASGVTLEIPGL